MIYLDNAATSYPKPPAVREAICRYLETAGNPGRSGHRMALAGEEQIWNARIQVGQLFGSSKPDRVVFTAGATVALNVAIKGLTRQGDRVLTTAFEHNSVVRPLVAWESRGVRWSAVPPSESAPIDFDLLEREVADPRTRLVVMSHASNVTGAVIPLARVRDIAHRYGALVVADTAQTAGHRCVSHEDADVLVFAGHKGLLGPQGTGGMIVSSDDVRIEPLIEGGTGGRSELRRQPRWLPYSLESGTPNGVGIAGLAAGVAHVQEIGVEAIAEQEHAIRLALAAGLAAIPGVTVYEVSSPEQPVCVVSATLSGMSAADGAALLDERFAVLSRGGLHCAPQAHETLRTIPTGLIRFSPSYRTTNQEIQMTLDAVREIQATVSVHG
jgi:cysteine desulfurase / selenocysteine lyase